LFIFTGKIGYLDIYSVKLFFKKLVQVIKTITMTLNNRKILIPVDFRKPSEKALHYSAYMAQKMHADLVLLHILDTPGLLDQFFSSTDYLVKITDEAKEKLLGLAGLVKNDAPGVNVTTRVEMGRPYRKILEVADELNVHMIILGENHQGGDPEDDLGTTVYHVTLKAKVPVLTFKGDTSKMKENIIVPLDLTKQTHEQLSAALFYGKEYGATIHLVSVLVGGISKRESRIYKKLGEARETFEMNGLECKMKLYDRSEEPPFMKVLEYADEVDGGIIFVMTHQEGYTYDNYIGAFAHHIMNLSKVPVLSLTAVSDKLDFSPVFKTLIDPIGVFKKSKIK
jgi:nucleotide-binding universal stress UspA family protein